MTVAILPLEQFHKSQEEFNAANDSGGGDDNDDDIGIDTRTLRFLAEHRDILPITLLIRNIPWTFTQNGL